MRCSSSSRLRRARGPGRACREPELGRRQLGVLAVDEGLHGARVDPQLLDHELLAAVSWTPRTPRRAALHARDELLHRERLDEVVVGPDLQRVHAVVLEPRALTTRIGVPMPSERACSISAQPSSPGSIQVEHDARRAAQ
jgi:hypothetical protein